jgi:hypothetical protein
MAAVVPLALFVGLASPQAFQLTTKIFGTWVARSDGLPALPGLFLHGLIFIALSSIILVLMGGKSSYITEGAMKFKTRDDQDDENTIHYQQDRFIV